MTPNALAILEAARNCYRATNDGGRGVGLAARELLEACRKDVEATKLAREEEAEGQALGER